MSETMIHVNQRRYQGRYQLLQTLAATIEHEVVGLLKGVPHVDRIYFRAKAPESFAEKSVATDAQGQAKYIDPFQDIEDQVAGRVLVFFRRDLDVVIGKLREVFNRAEQVRKAPKSHDAFAYESMHLVFILPPHLVPAGWEKLDSPPATFEMQVRTLFMHAWAEPEHDISYKAAVPLLDEEKRKLAWAASSAWGGDEIFEQVLDSIAERSHK